MTIRIDKLDVKNLGPIKNISFEFKDLNLIYGPNESGKTFIVEFLIRSLFRNYSKWSFRSNQANGELIVSGLTNNQNNQKLFPSSKRKINDFLSENYLDLPLNISRLLVIRGSDLFFEDKKSRVEKSVFIDFLSNQRIIASILKGIQKTVQNATIDENGINANEQGLNSERLNCLQNLN